MVGERGETGMSTKSEYIQCIDGGFGGGFRERNMGGVRLGERKIYSLSYADDMVLMAEDEEGTKAKK